MNRSIIFGVVFRIVAALVLITVIVSIGIFAYQSGVAQGVAQAGQFPAAEARPVYGMPYGMPFYGFGFLGPFGCLVPLLLVFLAFGAFRAMLWGGRMHHGPWGMHRLHWKGEPGEHIPPMVEEWHRRMHEGQTSASTEK